MTGQLRPGRIRRDLLEWKRLMRNNPPPPAPRLTRLERLTRWLDRELRSVTGGV